MSVRFLRRLLVLPLLLSLSACDAVVLKPYGDVALRQANLVVVSTILMLLIVLPVMALTVFFAWRYRASNDKARYEPEWNHSTSLELVIWSAPLLIIIVLGALTWITTHTLDPYRPLDRVKDGQALPTEAKALRVQVVALDWKWLFLYPDYGIATVNEMAAPVDRPIDFQITASTVMNSFYVPALAGQIYAMPAMETRLHAVINHAGDYEGFSANYSGAGFSHMRFTFRGLSDAEFAAWIARAQAAGGVLDRETYLQLEKPSEREPVRLYGKAAPGLYDAIVNLCVAPGKMCMRDMMAIDARGGLGLQNVHNVSRLRYDDDRRRDTVLAQTRDYVTALCATPDLQATPRSATPAMPVSARFAP